ncbi:uncharacterized protein BCR38DRAFT_440430 [Pseudomassariella vexata]|uniref:Uncharacterized protein n=1 Tax=Pseudomassariella vexata TaxID=1141098 RepID=A0A1Y2DS49_9PEZI|nr:uncharacterized protein BCR38DRAFT_440430 [Pseudomassariella vexata]ORY61505.1 hypothetical protein BCR38DRAFT_440430 [Pseudomassariella vexata]
MTPPGLEGSLTVPEPLATWQPAVFPRPPLAPEALSSASRSPCTAARPSRRVGLWLREPIIPSPFLTLDLNGLLVPGLWCSTPESRQANGNKALIDQDLRHAAYREVTKAIRYIIQYHRN